MSRIGQRPQSLIATITLAGAAIGYVTLIFLPGQKAIGRMRRDLHEKQQYIVQAERITFAIQQAEQEVQAAQAFAQDWRRDSPSQDRLPLLLGDITNVAQLSGMTITWMEPQERIQHNSIWRTSVDIRCEGEFREIFEFIQRVESLPATIWLSRVQIELASRNDRSIRSTRRTGRYKPDRGDKNGEIVKGEIVLMIFADKAEDSD